MLDQIDFERLRSLVKKMLFRERPLFLGLGFISILFFYSRSYFLEHYDYEVLKNT